MSEEEKICVILSAIQKIKESKQPVTAYSNIILFRFLECNTIAIAGLFRNVVKKGSEIREKMGIIRN